jgi:hypothetical protein
VVGDLEAAQMHAEGESVEDHANTRESSTRAQAWFDNDNDGHP